MRVEWFKEFEAWSSKAIELELTRKKTPLGFKALDKKGRAVGMWIKKERSGFLTKG